MVTALNNNNMIDANEKKNQLLEKLYLSTKRTRAMFHNEEALPIPEFLPRYLLYNIYIIILLYFL